ncbi:hypothetical protein HYW84_04260 [Candidatus Peregrinibacteria bacterium]|nr:hypothetical protein [Candidatus Peregrinibacteria bacterium]
MSTLDKENISAQELSDFLQEIFRQDQSDPARTKAYDCHEKLLARQGDFLGSELEDAYWDSLSREALHIAQIEAAMKHDHESALKYVRLALDYAGRVQSGFYTFDWINYLKGTEAYLLSDAERLQAIAEGCDANRNVLQNLLRGLRQSGAPDYARDYSAVSAGASLQDLMPQENIEHLQRLLNLENIGRADPTEVAWQLALHHYPELAEVVREKDTSSRFDGGSIVCPLNEDEPVGIKYNNFDLSVIEELMQHRPKSVQLVAERLGIPRESMTPLLLKTFIFLHEVGHTYDYITRFLRPLREGQDPLPKTYATADWRTRFQDELAALPIPNMAPSQLRMFSIFAPLPELARQQGAKEEVIRRAEQDAEAVLQEQEEAYKRGESEQRADDFATKILREDILRNNA